ncbi:MAG: hypothetical protein ACQEXJ_20285 [Myxococcota bacterium]
MKTVSIHTMIAFFLITIPSTGLSAAPEDIVPSHYGSSQSGNQLAWDLTDVRSATHKKHILGIPRLSLDIVALPRDTPDPVRDGFETNSEDRTTIADPTPPSPGAADSVRLVVDSNAATVDGTGGMPVFGYVLVGLSLVVGAVFLAAYAGDI